MNYYNKEIFENVPNYNSDVNIDIPKIDKSNLDFPICSIIDNSVPLCGIKLSFPTSLSNYKQPWLMNFMSTMMFKGTTKYNSNQISDIFDTYGAYYNASASKDTFSIALYCLKEHFSKLLDLLIDCLTDNIYAEDEVIKLQKRLSSNLQRLEKDADYISAVNIRKFLYPDHVYSLPMQGSLENISQIGSNDLIACCKYLLTDCSAFALLFGDFNEELIAATEGKINALQLRHFNFDRPKFELNKHIEPIKNETHLENYPQAKLIFARQSIGSNHENFPSLKFALTALGGYFGSRLNKVIREEKGYTYGIGSQLEDLHQNASIWISASLNIDSLNDTISEIKEQLSIMWNEIIDEEEFTVVKSYLLGNYTSKYTSIQNTSQNIHSDIIKHGNPYWTLEEFDAIKKLRPNDVLRLQHSIFNPDMWHVYTVKGS